MNDGSESFDWLWSAALVEPWRDIHSARRRNRRQRDDDSEGGCERLDAVNAPGNNGNEDKQRQ
jgi:hypothetical protein